LKIGRASSPDAGVGRPSTSESSPAEVDMTAYEDEAGRTGHPVGRLTRPSWHPDVFADVGGSRRPPGCATAQRRAREGRSYEARPPWPSGRSLGRSSRRVESGPGIVADRMSRCGLWVEHFSKFTPSADSTSARPGPPSQHGCGNRLEMGKTGSAAPDQSGSSFRPSDKRGMSELKRHATSFRFVRPAENRERHRCFELMFTPGGASERVFFLFWLSTQTKWALSPRLSTKAPVGGARRTFPSPGTVGGWC